MYILTHTHTHTHTVSGVTVTRSGATKTSGKQLEPYIFFKMSVSFRWSAKTKQTTKYKAVCTNTERGRERERGRDRQTDRETDRQTDRQRQLFSLE